MLILYNSCSLPYNCIVLREITEYTSLHAVCASEPVEMPSFVAYQILDVWIPSITVGLIFLCLFILVVYKVGMKLRRRKHRLVNRWFFEILRLAFRDLRRDKHGRNSIYDQEIGPVSFAILVVITVPVILSACFITFWNIYMVEEQATSECNTHYDCFPYEHGQALQQSPVHNCSTWPPGTHYKCYRLVYNYVQGVSATGGILFFASVMLKIYTATLLAPHNIRNVCCKWTCYCVVIVGGSIVALLFILIHTSIDHPNSVIFNNATHKIQFVLYAFLLFVVFVFTGPLLIYGIECESHHRREDTETIEDVPV